MKRYDLLSVIGLLFLVVALPLYAANEPERIDSAQADLRAEFVSDAAVMYVENCAVCHGAAGEGIGTNPPLDSDGLRDAAYDDLLKVISRGRYDTAMSGWHADEGGIYNDYQVDELIALIRYGDWGEVGDLAAARGLIPPTLPVPDIDDAFMAQVAALGPEGSQWAEGIQLFAANCTICHGVNGEGSVIGVALNTPEVRATETAVLSRIINEGVAGTAMGGWAGILAADEVAALTAFLQNWDQLTAEELLLTAPEPVWIDVDDPVARAELGAQLFATTCAACHGEEGSGGTGPVLNSQQVLTKNTDEMLLNTIVNGGHRPNSQMPAFGDRFTATELEILIEYVRAWEPTAPLVENPRGTAQGGGPPWLRDGGTGTAPGGGQGQGQGGPPAGAGPQSTGGGQTQAGPAVHLVGTAVAINSNMLTLQTDDGTQADVMLGPPWFWEESGILVAVGDRVEVDGFESADHTETNWLVNLTTGQRIDLRVDGMPVWNQ